MTGLITAPGFDINRTEEYKLSIQVSLDGFSFSATDINQNELLALGNDHFKLSSDKFLSRHFSEWINDKEILHKRYHTCNIICDAEKFTFIPSPFFDEKQQSLPASLVIDNNDDFRFLNTQLENGNFIFPVDSRILNTIETSFPGIKIQHPLTLLDGALRKYASPEETVLLVYFRTGSFSILLYNKNRLQLINNYDYHDAGDFLYYVLSAMNRMGLYPKNTTLYIAGEMSPLSKLYPNLVKYFLKTQFLTPEVRCDKNIFKEPLYRHIVLF